MRCRVAAAKVEIIAGRIKAIDHAAAKTCM
jgi:hypothetical protein